MKRSLLLVVGTTALAVDWMIFRMRQKRSGAPSRESTPHARPLGKVYFE